MADQETRDEKIAELAALIKDIRVAMLTTVTSDGQLRSRPMGTQKAEFDGNLWFFTHYSEPKVGEVDREEHVNVSFADPNDNLYVSVSGTATIVRDRKKMDELWDNFLTTWFPKGLEDPDLALLQVKVDRAEYWNEGKSGFIQVLAGFVKANTTGEQSEAGYGTKVDL